MRGAATVAIALVLLRTAAAASNTTSSPLAPGPRNFTVVGESPIMNCAIARARAGLQNFFDLAEHPRRGMRSFAVKFGLQTPHGQEYVWASYHRLMGERVLVTVDVDIRWSKDVKAGDPMVVEVRELSTGSTWTRTG